MRRPVGWRNEPHRHALARRGIRTSGRNMNNNSGKTRYYGVICDPTLKHYDTIEGDHDYKPTTESIGDPFGTVCKWFKNEKERDDFVKYAKEELGLRRYESSGRPIVLDIKGRGSFDGDLRISLEGAEELAPLLKSRGVALQAWSAFKSNSGTQKIEGRIKGVDVDLKVTHPGKNLYHVEGDMYYHIDRTFTREELTGFYEKAKELM